MRKFPLFFAIVSMTVCAAFAAWNGSTASPSTITEEGVQYYSIHTPEELAWVAAQVKGGKTAINAKLANNLVFGSSTSAYATIDWTPIGDTVYNFNGVLDGAGYTIYGLSMNSAAMGGLMGVVGTSGVVRNLTIRKSKFLIKEDDATNDAGSIAAINKGKISNCISYADSVKGAIAGGLVGQNLGTIESSRSYVTKVKSGSYAGGIAAANSGSIFKCGNYGSVYAGGTPVVSSTSVTPSSGGTYIEPITGQEITDGHPTTTFKMARYAGGIAASNEGTIDQCENYGGLGIATSLSSLPETPSAQSTPEENLPEAVPILAAERIYENFYYFHYYRYGGIAALNYGTVKNVRNFGQCENKESVSSTDNGAYGFTFRYYGYFYAGVVFGNSGNVSNGFSASNKMEYGIGYTVTDGTFNTVFFDKSVLPDTVLAFSETPSGLTHTEGLSTSALKKLEMAWYLNTSYGTTTNSGAWCYDAGYPRFANANCKATYRVTFSDGGANKGTYYTNKNGALEGLTTWPTGSVKTDGTVFVGWYNSKGEKVTQKTVITADQTLTAKYENTASAKLTAFFYGDSTLLYTATAAYGSNPTSIYAGSTPTRAKDVAYTYTWAGTWSPSDALTTDETTYRAVFDAVLNKYTVTFLYSGAEYDKQQVEYGKAATKPTDPEVPSNKVFVGWDKDISRIEGNLTTSAIVADECFVTFKYLDETLKVDRVGCGYGATAPAAPQMRTRKLFGGWDKDFSKVTEDMTVNAVEWDECIAYFTVYHDTVKTESVACGTAPTAPELPKDDEDFHYAGWGWTPDHRISRDTEIPAIMEMFYKVLLFNENCFNYSTILTTEHWYKTPKETDLFSTVTYWYLNPDATIQGAFRETSVELNDRVTMLYARVGSDYGGSSYYKLSDGCQIYKEYLYDTDTTNQQVENKAYARILEELEKINALADANANEASSSSSTVNSSSSSVKPSYSSSSSVNPGYSSSSSVNPGHSSSSVYNPDGSSSSAGMSMPEMENAPRFTLKVSGRSLLLGGLRIAANYEIFDMQGHLILSGRAAAANILLQIPRAGAYLVRVGSATRKIAVR